MKRFLQIVPRPTGHTGVPPLEEAAVRRILAARRVREQQLGPELFADPAWDLLLEALAADAGQKPLSLSRLKVAANVPPSTAERWIRKLESDGWLRRTGSFGDDDQQVSLTPEGSAKLRQLFKTVAPMPILI